MNIWWALFWIHFAGCMGFAAGVILDSRLHKCEEKPDGWDKLIEDVEDVPVVGERFIRTWERL